MKLITRHTDDALSALSYIAQQDEPVSAAELSTAIDMPHAFLRGILQKLQSHNLLTSTRGKNGGFTLAVDPTRITVYDIMVIFQDTSIDKGCPHKKRPCHRQKTCVLRQRLSLVQEKLREELQALTIAALARDGHR
jgi:Rrf2 family protein